MVVRRPWFKAICSCLQLERVRYHGPNLYAFPVNWSRIEEVWLNCEYCRKQLFIVNVPRAGMSKKNSTFRCLKSRPSRRLEMSRNICPVTLRQFQGDLGYSVHRVARDSGTRYVQWQSCHVHSTYTQTWASEYLRCRCIRCLCVSVLGSTRRPVEWVPGHSRG